MIMLLFLFLRLVCLCRLRNMSIINLILLIISISLCISLIFYWKYGSIFALLWVLLYLGGMMVCFVYFLFVMVSAEKSPQSPMVSNWFRSSWKIVIFTIFIRKVLITKPWKLYGFQVTPWGSSLILSSEVYGQIVSQATSFFFVSILLLLYGLLQILSMLNIKRKSRSSSLL